MSLRVAFSSRERSYGINMATKTILGLAAVVAMTFIPANDVSAHNYGWGGGGRGLSIQIGGGGFGGYPVGGFGGFGGYGGGFGNSFVQTTSFYRPVYHRPAVQVYRAPQVIVAPVRGGYGRPGCNGGYRW